MIVTVDRTMVFKEVNSSPLQYSDMLAQYKGTGTYPYVNAKIRKLLIRSFDFWIIILKKEGIEYRYISWPCLPVTIYHWQYVVDVSSFSQCHKACCGDRVYCCDRTNVSRICHGASVTRHVTRERDSVTTFPHYMAPQPFIAGNIPQYFLTTCFILSSL